MARVPIINEQLDKIADALGYQEWLQGQSWGFIEHGDTLSPSQRIEYIGKNKDYTPFSLMSDGRMSYGSWADNEFLRENRPAMVKADGALDYWLNPDDYTLKADGTASDVANVDYDGNAFAWIPKIYKSEQQYGADRYVRFSMKKMDGFEPVGFVDPDGNELPGVWIPLFYGWKDSSNRMRSIANGDIGTASTTTAQENTYITAMGSRYKFFGGAIIETLVDLMILFVKNTDLQSAYGKGNMSGYDSTSTTYGKKANVAENCGQFYGTMDGKSINRAFHSMVLLTQNVYHRDPYLLVVSGKVKVSKDYRYDLSGATYADAGLVIPDIPSSAWTYPNYRRFIEGFGSFPEPSPNNGSTSLGICDGVYRSATQSSFVAVVQRFAYCNSGANGGPRCLDLYDSAGNAYWTIGASLLLLPPI